MTDKMTCETEGCEHEGRPFTPTGNMLVETTEADLMRLAVERNAQARARFEHEVWCRFVRLGAAAIDSDCTCRATDGGPNPDYDSSQDPLAGVIITIELDRTGPDAWRLQCTCGFAAFGYANQEIARVHARQHAVATHGDGLLYEPTIDVIDSRRD